MLKVLAELKIPAHDARYKVVTGLIESGYAVRVVERKKPATCIGTEHLAIVYEHVDEVVCPDGSPRKPDKVDLYEMIEEENENIKEMLGTIPDDPFEKIDKE